MNTSTIEFAVAIVAVGFGLVFLAHWSAATAAAVAKNEEEDRKNAQGAVKEEEEEEEDGEEAEDGEEEGEDGEEDEDGEEEGKEEEGKEEKEKGKEEKVAKEMVEKTLKCADSPCSNVSSPSTDSEASSPVRAPLLFNTPTDSDAMLVFSSATESALQAPIEPQTDPWALFRQHQVSVTSLRTAAVNPNFAQMNRQSTINAVARRNGNGGYISAQIAAAGGQEGISEMFSICTTRRPPQEEQMQADVVLPWSKK